ncbi:MAG: penicillin-binding transpeptidase domain-containing protein, partial [Pseudomonadota bacterium]
MTRNSFSPFGVGRAQQAEEQSRSVTRRAAVVSGFTALIGMALALRMRQLQVVETERYRLLAEENRINLRLIAPVRAEIYDRKGIPLAINTQNYRVVMVREQTNSVDQTLDDLGQLIPIGPRQREKVVRDLRSKSAFVPVSVAEHLSWQEFSRINANAPALPGIQPEVGLSRHYPHGELTAHVVGYVGRVTKRDIEKLDEVDPVLQIPEFQIGKTGVEKAVEGDLRGEAGSRHIEVNARGRVVRELDRQDGLSGSDLYLTLDLDLQDAVQKRLGSESAAAVLIDLRDGDLLALSSSPSYDPNPFVQGISQNAYSTLLNDDHRPLHNKWASGMYPPGSTFKMVVALAALEAGVVGPGETVYCPGHMTLGNRRFHCWKRGG